MTYASTPAATSANFSILEYRLLKAIANGLVYRTETNVDMRRDPAASGGRERVSLKRFLAERLAELDEATRYFRLTSDGEAILAAWVTARPGR